MRGFFLNSAKNRIDLSDKQFYWWKVIDYSHTKNKQPFWLCECRCGTKKIVGSNSLRNGSKSCGNCGSKKVKRKNHMDPKIITINNIYARYRCEAKKRNLEFNLNKLEFIGLIEKDCFYCKKSNGNFQKMDHDAGIYYYNGIDRVDNDCGYNLNNCVPCCKICNTRKKSVSKDMIYKAYHFLFKDNI